MATFVNDLRLTELATGEGSGTWGTTTNQSLELIGESLGYATQQAFSSDADATTTVADGVSDPARAMYFKVTSAGSLSATRTLTIAPNTISRVMFIENATSGSQSIAISQGSGANVTILTGKTAVVYLDGAGSGAAVVDAMLGVDPGVTDTLTEVLVAGNTSGGTNIELSTTDKVQFRDAAIYINSSADGQLDLIADTEIQIAATTVDLNGNLDISGTATGASSFATAAGGTFTTAAGNDLNIVYPDGRSLFFKEAGTTTLTLDNAQGATFAGTIAAGAATFTTADNLDTLSLISTDADASVGPNLSMYRNSGSPADNDQLGQIQFTGKNDAAEDVDYAVIGSQISDASNGEEDGRTFINSMVSGTLHSRIDIRPTETIFNNESINVDFRVESDNSSAMLFVDASTDRVGVGVAAPAYTLDVQSSTTNAVRIRGTSNLPLYTYHDSSGVGLSTGEGASYSELIYMYPAADAIRFYTGGVLRNEFSPSTNTFNENGLDTDFRVESDANANGLMLDASTSTVGVNRAASSAVALSVNATATNSSTYAFEACNSSTNTKFIVRSDGYIGFYKTGNAAGLIHNTDGAITITPDAGGHFVFNEDSVDADFRVESNGNANMLFIDANNNRVGIGTGAPSYEFVVSKDGSSGIEFGPEGINSTTSFIQFYNRSTAAYDTARLYLKSFELYLEAAQVIALQISTTEAVINQSGVDLDFRVETDGDANALFINGATNSVNVGSAYGGNSKFTVNQSASEITCYLQNTLSTVANSTPSIIYLQTPNDAAIQDGFKMVTFADQDTVLGTISTAATSTNVAYNTSSDERLKERIVDAGSQLDTLLAVKVREYDWKKNGFHSTGFIAQELHEHIPEAVTVGLEDPTQHPWSVDYGRLTPFIIKAMQEQQELIKTLEARIAALES